MKRDDWPRTTAQVIPRKIAILFNWVKVGRGILQMQAKPFERPGQLKGGMRAVIELSRTGHKRRRAATLQIVFKDSIRIVEIAQDQIESPKIISQLARQFRVLYEKPCERGRFDGANRVRIETLFDECCNPRVAKDFQVRFRKPIAEELERRQSQNKISERAATEKARRQKYVEKAIALMRL